MIKLPYHFGQLKIITLFLAVSFSFFQSKAQNSIGSASAQNSLRGSGMSFTQNKGQIVDMSGNLRPDILYKGSGGGADVYLRKTGLSYVLSNVGEVVQLVDKQVEEAGMLVARTPDDKQKIRRELLQKQNIKIHRVDVDLINMDPNATVISTDKVDGYSNYYLGHCPQGITNVNSYNEVFVKNIYNNIDVKYYGDKERGLKYDIVVNPGGKPDDIKLKYSGANQIEIKNEKLIIKNSIREITEQLPKVYQNINGKIIDVKTEYRLEHLSNNDVIVHFSFSIFNSSFPLVIDPWATYFSGSGGDDINSITTDPSGNVLFTGELSEINFPVSANAFQMNYAGGNLDAFVVKMNDTGNRIWATYYGGASPGAPWGWDKGTDIAADNAGNIAVAGITSQTDFPVGASAGNFVHQSTLGGLACNCSANDAFLLKLDPGGARLWATYYGGSSFTDGLAVTTDGTNIYLTGETTSINGIATSGAFQQTHSGGSNDVFVAKFSPTGIRMWGTYLGGSNLDIGGDIAYDAVTSNIYITGFTYSTDFPVSAGCHQPSFGGGSNSFDAFLFKLDLSGTTRLWATYYGGSNLDWGQDVAVDALGNVILGGFSLSTNAISTPLSFQPNPQGSGYPGDGFIAKFSQNGIRIWGTYLGGISMSPFADLAVDKYNYIYVYGEFEEYDSHGYPISSCAYQRYYGGGEENQYIAKYEPGGRQTCFTYYGGPGSDEFDVGEYGVGIAIHDNSLYITGNCTSGGYPVTSGTFQTVFVTGVDVTVAQLCINICEAKVINVDYTANSNLCNNTPITFTPTVTVTNACEQSVYTYSWTFSGGTPATSDSMKPTVIFSGSGNHDVKLIVESCKKDSITKTITINPCNPCLLSGQFAKGTANCPGCGCKQWVMLTASGGASPYIYTWPDGYDKRYKNQLCPGSYTINIKDKNGCSVNVNLSAP